MHIETEDMVKAREKCKTRKEYLKHLEEVQPTCEGNNVGILMWKPDDTTPKQVYYQVRFAVLNSKILGRSKIQDSTRQS